MFTVTGSVAFTVTIMFTVTVPVPVTIMVSTTLTVAVTFTATTTVLTTLTAMFADTAPASAPRIFTVTLAVMATDTAVKVTLRTDTRRHLVDVLPSRPPRARRLELDVLGLNLDRHVVDFRHNRHRRRARVHPALCLRRRYSLPKPRSGQGGEELDGVVGEGGGGVGSRFEIGLGWG